MTTPVEDSGEPEAAPRSITPVVGSTAVSDAAPTPAEPPALLAPDSPRPVRRVARSRYVWRALVEVGIVTVGVLVAFALNAWWTERIERRQEQAHLRALISDVEWNLGALREFIGRQERVSEATAELLEIALNTPDAPAARVEALVGPVFTSARFEPVTGAYDALLNSGGLTLVRETALRASLATFAARLEDRYAERFADELYQRLIQEFAGQIHFADRIMDRPARGSFAPLLRNPRFQDFLALRQAGERGVTEQYQQMATAADTILTQLRAELR
jgi:hypothetical protein